MTVSSKINHQPVLGAGARWRRNGVEWEKFTDAVEEGMGNLPEEPNMINRVQRFNDILYNAAIDHIGKVKPRKKKENLWMTPTVRGCIRRRNRIRREMGSRRQEWKEACKETNDAIREAKGECWREVVEDALSCEDEGKMWNFIKTLNGTPDTNSPNEVLVVNGRKLSSNSKKADAFIEQYADVSRLKFSKEERNDNRKAKRMLRKSTVDDESTVAFSMNELEKAIQKTRKKGASGDDDIPPTFLKDLGTNAKKELLDIFNKSFDDASIPQVWRCATIIPLLKAAKPPGALASFRPVSLTSCVVKTMERMIAARLYNIAETRNMLSPLQAGFRKGRSCEDQILKIVQSIEDGFQQKPMKRSVLVMLDYSKAYDRVWQQRLLLSMDEKGVPMKFLRWLSAFLSNRLAKVRFQDCKSKTRVMRQGLPQGAVLSPLLFLFFIDNLTNELPEETVNALFADDANVLATESTKEEAAEMAQRTVNIIADWSRRWKLDLNATKSECSFFSTDTHESKWQPTIKLHNNEFDLLYDEGDEFTFRKTPRLLGVILDRQLSFGAQVNNVTKEASNKLKLLAVLSRADWGWCKNDLRKLYFTFCRSKMMYAPSSWQPWCATAQTSRLERVQNKALRIINGQYRDSPCEALRKEANICTMDTTMRREAIKSAEKALRMPEDHPRRTTWENSIAKRCRKSWSSECLEAQKGFPQAFNNRQDFYMYATPPWLQAAFQVYPKLPGLVSRHEAEETRRKCAISRLNELGGDWIIYTDGSADAGITKGGSAAVVTRGSAEDPEVVKSILRKGADLTCSCEEETEAMKDAVDWINENSSAGQKIVIATDSQSLCSALLSRSEDAGPLVEKLSRCPGDVIIQWIPGHSEIPGNEIADAKAKEAAGFPGEGRPTSYKSACATVNRLIKDPPVAHDRTREVYSAYSLEKEKQITSRKDQVLLARVRSGKYLGFDEYRAKVKHDVEPNCKRCSELTNENDNLEHWLKCPGTLEARIRLFGKDNVGLSILTENPQGACKLAQRTLRLGSKEQ